MWSDQSEFRAFLWFLICGLALVLFLSLVIDFGKRDGSDKKT